MDLYVKKFKECPTYEQESGPNVEYRRLLPRGVVADLSMGLVTLAGPTYTKTGRHTDWYQVYLVISGSGTVKIGEKALKSGSKLTGCAMNWLPSIPAEAFGEGRRLALPGRVERASLPA